MRITLLLLLGFLFIASGCTNSSDTNPFKDLDLEEIKMEVIYGDDNRQDLYQVTDQMKYTLSNSTVALIYKENLEPLDGNNTKIKSRSYAKTYQLCPEEPFYEQDVAAFCSGFLVGPQTIITAGHCIRAQTCERTRFVFGYAITTAGQNPQLVPNENVYSCASVTHSQQLREEEPGPDFAVVTLDRQVTGHAPLSLRTQDNIQNSEPLFVVGHPAGLPTKVAGGANVRDTSHEAFFIANLDTYGGNSGSAVFNENTGSVEGILVRGELDYVTKKGSNCQVSNVCKNDGCMGEHVTRIKYVLPYLNKDIF
ncbi:MAG: hypothetical protein A4S09_11390 [Proteobacteria bacterium SG_bin7]|nr:MAG: hypothetical protein A4S09_11390 [Proteobacteria bacterium SG_bin7]